MTIDAWHNKPSADKPVVDLSAFVSFQMAEIGGQPQDDIRFKLRLKEASVEFIPEGEPGFSVERDKTWRGDPVARGSVETKSHRSSVAKFFAKIGFGVSKTVVKGDVSTQIDVAGEGARSIDRSSTQELRPIYAAYSTADNRRPAWRLVPSGTGTLGEETGDFLVGPAFPEASQRLLTLKDRRRDQSQEDEPGIRFRVRCRRPDAQFYDIYYRDEERNWQPTSSDEHEHAAIEFLRQRLLGAELHADSPEEDFSIMILGEGYSEPISRYESE